MGTSPPRPPGLLNDPAARTLTAGDLEAVFLPSRGMIGASLRHRGAEILRRVADLEAAAAKGSTAGIPLLHPWSTRLAEPRHRPPRHSCAPAPPPSLPPLPSPAHPSPSAPL